MSNPGGLEGEGNQECLIPGGLEGEGFRKDESQP